MSRSRLSNETNQLTARAAEFSCLAAVSNARGQASEVGQQNIYLGVFGLQVLLENRVAFNTGVKKMQFVRDAFAASFVSYSNCFCLP